MPPLDRATLEALTESIREHGVIVPVVKDQTGFVLDGNNRIAIAAALGVAVPEVIFECEEDQRAILSIELNGARRQITEEQWKPLVDHLRALGYADRVVAKAVGVDLVKVNRYKSPKLPGVSSDTPGRSVLGEDGKTYRVGGGDKARDRMLFLIRQSANGLTIGELQLDSVLASFGRSTVSSYPGRLRDQGLIEEAGKRGKSIVWRAVDTTEAKRSLQEVQRAAKAKRFMDDLRDPDFRRDIDAMAAEGKLDRKALAALRVAERELDAATAFEEKLEVETQKEQIRSAALAREQATKSLKYWENLTGYIGEVTRVLIIYYKDFDDLPPLSIAQVRILVRALEELKVQLHYFDVKLHPHGHNRVARHGEGVIDIG
jgi:hypothetical protein